MDECVKFFLPRRQDRIRAAALRSLFEGDWRRTDVIDVAVPACVKDDPVALERWKRQRVADILKSGAWALMPESFRVFNRADWDGFEDAMRNPGILEVFHGLLSPLLSKFLLRFDTKRAEARPGAAAGVVAPIVAGADGSDAAALARARGEDAASVVISDAIVALREHPVDFVDELRQSTNDNEKHRKRAREFVKENSSAKLPWLYVIDKPLGHMLKEISQLGGEHSNLVGLARAAKDPSYERRTPLQIAASGEIENRAKASIVSSLSSTSGFAILRPELRTERVRSDCFTTGSRALACIETNLAMPHQHPQMQMCHLLNNPADAAEIELRLRSKRKECCQQAIVESMCAKHASLQATVARAKIASLAQARPHIGHIEVGHSRYRRALVGASHNTHRMSLPDAGAAWAFSEYRRRRALVRKRSGELAWRHSQRVALAARRRAKVGSRKAPERGAGSRKRKSGGGGAFRAYCQMRRDEADGWNMTGAHSQLLDVTNLAQEYRRLSGPKLQEVRHRGKEMTLEWRARRDGPNASVSKRARHARSRKTALADDALQQARAAAEDLLCHDAPIPSEVVAFDASMSQLDCLRDVQSHARRDLRALGTVSREQEQASTGVLRKFVEDNSDKFSALVPRDMEAAVSQFVPSRGLPGVASDIHFFPDAERCAKRLVGAAVKHPRLFQGLSACLDSQWSKWHSPVLADDGEVDGDVLEIESTQRLSRCLLLGLCVEEGVGHFSDKVALSFEHVLKRAMPKKTIARQYLDRSDAFAEIRVPLHRPDGTWDDDALYVYHVHLAFVCWSPCYIMVQRVTSLSGCPSLVSGCKTEVVLIESAFCGILKKP
jgi:hypothetical protein